MIQTVYTQGLSVKQKKLEQYELAVFSGAKQNSSHLETADVQIEKVKSIPQFSLFASSNESVIDELRGVDFAEMSEIQLKQFLFKLQKRLI